MSKTATINMRIDESQRTLLNKAAEALGMDRSTFILTVACQEAKQILLDQRLFQLDDEQYQAFHATLNAPIDTHKLHKLLQRTSPWET